MQYGIRDVLNVEVFATGGRGNPKLIEFHHIKNINNIKNSRIQHDLHNCINCGAPLHKNNCDYCGTEY